MTSTLHRPLPTQVEEPQRRRDARDARDARESFDDGAQDWTARGACAGSDPDGLFVSGAAQNRAKVVCQGCPVRTECLSDALDNQVEFGVWGGMTERERRALLKRRPEVTSWRELLLSARAAHEAAVRAS